MENERKFLVEKIPKGLFSYDRFEIKQQYLSIEPEIRIRESINKRTSHTQYFFTVKGKGDLSRVEYELELTEKLFDGFKKDELLFLCKLRYIVPLDDGNKAELDIYYYPFDTVVEVEFKSEKDAKEFIIPNWFGKEVTYDKYYKNKNLFKIINNL